MTFVRRLALYLLLVTTVMAASKCGKRAYRSKLGKQTTFQSVQEKARCRYRIRSNPGFHIKLNLDNYYPEKCCMQIVISQERKGQKDEKVTIPQGPRVSLLINASIAYVVVKSTPSAKVVDISHEAVMPADGDFGYSFRAIKKPRMIRSPKFPNMKLPSGVKSVWNVTTKQEKDIQIAISGLLTVANQDFLEIFDGDTSLGRFSGRKKRKDLPIKLRATSGNMIIILETQTDRSKGFRANVAAKDKEDRVEPETSELDENLECHKRTRVTSNGGIVTDDHTRMICGEGEICGRMVTEGSTVIAGTNLSVTNEVLHCIPRSFCTGSCDQIPIPDASILVKSCQLSCCDTNMCNSSPDGPYVPPTRSAIMTPIPPWMSEEGALHCNEGSSVQRQSDGGMSSGSGGSGTCLPGSVCALYVFSGVSKENTMDKVVGYVQTCAVESSCGEAGDCSNLDETRDVNLRSCNVTCCKEEYCNNEYDVVLPTLPPHEPMATSCLDIRMLQIGNITHTDDQSYSTCSNAETRCLRVDAYVKNRDGKHGVAAFGKCVAKNACDNLDCSSLLGLEDSVTATSCNAECCANDMCNDIPLRVPVPPNEEGALWCHRQSVIVQEGAIQYSGDRDKSNLLCNEGEVCAYFKFYGTSTKYYQAGEPMAGYGAMCQPKSACNEDTCQALPNAKDVNVTSCEATCCNTSMCNELGEPPMPSPRAPVAGVANKCYRIMQTSVNGMSVSNEKTAVTCGSSEVCFRFDAGTIHSGLDVSVAYGGCASKFGCTSMSCDSVSKAVPGIPIRDCRKQCCETDLCNGQPIPITDEATSPQHDNSSMSVTSGASSEGNMTAVTINRCYNTLQMTSNGMPLPGSKKDIEACEPGSQCFKMITVSSLSSMPGVSVKTTIGACAPKATCAARTCASTPSKGGMVVESCDASCCDGDLCNN